ncbi:ABC transporter substrate-binding protein [Brachyspira hyodysenteriae]|nr:ABC transporter substrate-binding protein [Brachyspira hyodysenteriae]KLI47613.1 ABC transporter substrate-binding protein [Brachyspira hyodysenteriae]MBT8718834.1 extracellular solute-binding protein [Brachyspira hyodysenteriae]MBT8728983.1 extracellular solute-binding protein [Brachyspira hyodysenteriae]MBT8731658.1 extracellular solute-binding protein [Brachyspira hyodysenteriae]MBT8734240.1 extracellular solute-binding protein [Brachyspira hyodysenteriae]
MKKYILTILFCAMFFYSCSSKESNISNDNSLVIYCPHPLDFINPLIDDFKAKNPGINVDVIAAGTGELIKRVESEKNNPLGDILWGGSLNLIRNKIELFENYTSTNEENIAEAYKNTEGALTRFTTMPSVIMVNTNLAGNIKIEGYEDLLNPELKGKIAAADPSASSSAFEHLVNMLYAMGKGDPEKGWDYVSKLCANLDGKLLSGSSAVYKGVADGEYTVGLTFEEGGANYVSSGSPVKLVYMKEGVVFKADGIYIIKNAKNLENAKKFVDYATSYDAQKTINDNLNRRSVRVDLPSSTILQSVDTINIIKDDETVVDQNKQNWLNKFKDIFTSI